MKKVKNYVVTAVIATALIFTITSCQKQPNADFTTDKSEYVAGETVQLLNRSIDGNTYKWTMPDGQTTTSKDVNYSINQTLSDGTLTFALEAISRNGKKTDRASKTVTVRAATGQLTVWTSNANVNPISVYIDNVFSGTITLYYNGVPTCGATGCVTSTLPVGSHLIYATDGNYVWDYSMAVNANGCSTFQLQ